MNIICHCFWPIRTYKPQVPPTFLASGTIRNSILGPGGRLSKCRIENSIISPKVTVEEGAEIVDSILFEGVTVRKGAKVRRAIIDKFADVPTDVSIGADTDKDCRQFKVSKDGITVVPKGWKLE